MSAIECSSKDAVDVSSKLETLNQNHENSTQNLDRVKVLLVDESITFT